MADIPKDKNIDRNAGVNPEKVLRAKDVFPPFDKPAEQIQSKNYREDLIPPLKGSKPAPVEDSETVKSQDSVKENYIPKFDLADQIMSEHRKITSERRKLRTKEIPKQESQLNQPPVENEKQSDSQHTVKYNWNESDQIIKMIVARDISKMLGL